MNRKDVFSALALLALGAFALLQALRLPVGTPRAPDMAFFPVLLSSLLIVLSMILLGQSLRSKRVQRGRLNLGEHWKKLIPVIVSLIAYCYLVEPVGYIISTILVIILVAKIVNCSWMEALTISVVCTVVSYVLVVHYLKSPLPQGIMPF